MLTLARFGVPALLVVAVVLGAAWPSLVRGAVRTWDGGAGNGLWSSAANWSGDLLPGAGDTAQFDATNTGDVSIDANISVQGISINAGYTGTITQAAGRTVSVGTAGFIQGAGAFVGGDLAITITNGVFTQTAGSFTSTSGILTVPNAFTISGGSFAHNNGTVAFSTNNATIDVVTSLTLNNLSFLSGTKTVAAGDTLVALGTLTLANGAVNTGTLDARGDVTVASTFTTSSSVSLLLDGAGNQTVTGFHIPTSGDLPALVINKPSGNLTLAGTLRTTHNWTFTAVPGTFSTAGSVVVFAGGTITGSHTLEGVDIRGTVTLAAGTTLTATGSLNLFSGALNQAAATGTLAAQGNVDVQVGFTTGGTATLLLTGSANQTLTSYHTALVGDLPVVVINKPAGNLTLAPAGPGTGIIRTSHNWTFSAVGGTFTTTGATVVFTSGTVTGSHTLANVDIRGGTVTIAAGTTLNVGTYLNFVSGAIATGTLAAQGTVDIQLTAISTTSTATLLLNGAGNQTVTGFHTTLVGDLPPLAINKPSGNLTLAGTLRTGHNWTFTAVGGTFTTAGSTVVFTGGTISGSHTLTTVEIRGTVGIAVGTTLTASGYLNLFSGAVNLGTLEAQANVDVQSGFTGASTGTLLLDGAGNQTVTGFHIPTSGDLPALVINKPSGNLTLAGTLRTTHNWTFTAVPGTFSTAGSVVVFAGGTITGSHTLEGVDIRGTVTLAAGTTLTATGSLNLFSGALNQAAATGTLAAQGNVDVQVGFTTGGTATLLLTGSANQTLTSYHTALVGDLPVVVINKPAGNLTLAPAGPGTGIIRTSHNWTFSAVGGTFTTTGATVVFTSGTVTGSHTLANVDIRGGTVTIAAGTTLNVGTYLNFVSGAIATGTLAAQGTVDIQLTAISTTSTATLLLNGAGNQTVTGFHTTLVGDLPPLAINKPSGNLTLAGTLRTGHNWTFTAVGGTFTTAGSTVVFTGGTISGSHALTTVEIRGTVGIAVGTTLTASGYLNLFSGAVNLGTLEAQANVDVQSGFTGASTGTLLLDGAGNQTVTGFHIPTSGDLPALVINKPSGNLTLAGTLRTTHNWTFTAVPGTFSTAGSVVVFAGGTITGSHTLEGVDIRGTVTLAAGTTLTATGSLNLFSGALNQAAATGTLAAQGNVDVQVGFTTGGTATLLLTGSANQTLTSYHTALVGDLPVVVINKPAGNLTLAPAGPGTGIIRTSHNWTFSAVGGTFTTTGATVVFTSGTVTGSHTLANVDIRGGTVTIAAGTTLNVGTYLNFVSGAIATGTLAAQGTVDIQLTAISTTSTATLLLNGAGNQTVTGFHTTLVGDLPPLAINKPSGNLTLAGTLRTGHNWTFTAVGGTFTTAGSTVVFTGGTISGSHTLTTVEIRGTVGIAVGTTLTASGYLNLFSGAVNLGTLEAQANVDVQSGFTGASTGTLLLDGAGNQTVTGFHIPTSGDLPALVINKPSGNLTLAGTLRTTHNWTFTAVPGTFSTAGSVVVFAGGTITGSHTLEGVWIRGGTVTIAAATTLTATGYVNLFSGVVNTGTLEARADVDVQAGFTGGTATLLINGAGNQTVGGNHTLTVGDLPNVTINKPSGNLTLAPAGPSYTGILRTSHNWTFVSVPGTSTTTGSTMVFVGGTITGSHTLDSVWIRGGTITIAAGTTVTATGYVSLFSGAVNGGTLEARADVDVQAGFTTGGTATLLINGTGNQTIGGNHTLTAGELPNVVINKPSGNLTLAPAGPSYTGILRTSHNWTYVSVPGTFTTTGSTMVFTGGTISGSHTLDSVRIRGGTITIAAGTTVTATGYINLFSGVLNGGTLAAQADVDVQVGFTGGTATLLLNGAGNQTMTSYQTLTVGDLPALVINKPAGNLTLAPAGPGTGIFRTSHNWTFVSVPGTFTTTGTTLVFTGGTITGSHTLHNVEIRGTVTIAIGSTLAANGYVNLFSGTLNGGTLAARGAIDAQSGFTGGGSATLLIDGSSPQTFTGNHTTTIGDLPNIQISSSSTVTLAGTLRLNAGTWTYVTGTVATAPASQVVLSGVVTVTGSHTLGDVYFNGSGSKTVAAGTTLTATGLVTLDNGSIDVGTVAAQANVVYLSTFDGGTGTLALTGAANQTFTGSATPTTGDIPDLLITKTGGTVSLVGTIRTTNDWILTSGTLDAGTSLVVFAGSGTTLGGTQTFYDLVVTGGPHTIGAGAPAVAGSLTLTDGTLDGGTLGAAGNVTVAGTFDGGTGTLALTGAANQTFTGSATPTTGDIPDLLITKTGGTVSLVGTIRTTNDWILTSGTLDAGTSLVVFAGSGTTLGGTQTFYDLVVTGGPHTIGAGAPAVAGSLTLTDGTLDGGTLGAAGNVTVAGTFDGGTGTLALTGAANQTFTGSATPTTGDIPDLLITKTGGTVSLVGTIRTTNDWILTSGTLDAGTSLVVFAGILTVDNGGSTLNNVMVNAGTGTVTLASDLDADGYLDVAAGTLDTASHTVTVAGDVTIDGAFIPGTGELRLDGSVAQVLGGSTIIGLYDLTIANGAGVTLTAPASVGGTLTLNGPFDFSGQTLSIENAIGGTPTNLTASSTSTLIISGSGAGIVIPSSVPLLANLTLDNPNGAALDADLTVGTLLTLTDGILDSGPYTTIVGPGGSVSRASGHVAGALRKTLPTGSGVAVIFEIGDLSVYTPVDLTFAAVSGSGTLTASTVPTEHPAVGSSVIDPASDVNRWWRVVNAGAAFSTVDARFTWDPTDVDPGADPTNFVVAKWDGSWTLPSSGGATGTTIVAYGMTGFSEFAVGGVSDEGEGLPDTAQTDPDRMATIVLAELLGLFVLLLLVAAGVRRGRRPTA